MEKIYLEDVVIAIQKSFSRVNEATAKNELKTDAQTPTSKLSGDIEFTITTKANPDGKDKLEINENGYIEFCFKGKIDLDIDDDVQENQGSMAATEETQD